MVYGYMDKKSNIATETPAMWILWSYLTAYQTDGMEWQRDN
jgi:hypothetical protein